MINQEMNLPLAERFDLMARPADIGQTIAAITAITRREWMSRGPVALAIDELAADRSRLTHPTFSIASGAERGRFWRAPADQQGRTQDLEPTAKLDHIPDRAR
jgi:hypothetical protein